MSLPEVPELVNVAPDLSTDPGYSIAIIKDGFVYQVMNTDGQTAALLLSDPIFVQVDNTVVSVGDKYDEENKVFSK